MERGKVHQARRLTNLCLGNRVRYINFNFWAINLNGYTLSSAVQVSPYEDQKDKKRDTILITFCRAFAFGPRRAGLSARGNNAYPAAFTSIRFSITAIAASI